MNGVPPAILRRDRQMLAQLRPAPLVLAAVALASGCFGGDKKKTELHCDPPAVCGDVDADGAKDEVRIEGDRLIVRTHDDELMLALAAGGLPPFVNGLAPIDRRPGLEIVATTDRGASTAFASVFTVLDEQLVRMSPDFAYEGSVTHLDGIDCAPDRPGVVVATAIGIEKIEQRTYRARAKTFSLIRKNTLRQKIPIDEPQPFPNCMEVRSG